MAKKTRPIGILGGTFHPIHKGHVMMAHIALEELNLKQVWFLPDGMPPHKSIGGVTPAQRLEMVRLAPSAKNAQPWRIVKDEDKFHFYEKRDIGIGAHDIQRLDVGIALCHFELAAKEKGISGHIVREEPQINKGELIYVFTWVKD